LRVVLDTNVLLAAFISRGLCHDLLEHCVREHEVVLSEFLLEEFTRNLMGKFRVPDARMGRAETLLCNETEIVEPAPLPVPVCRDPDDDWVLATAITGACRCIVTGDKDFLTIGGYDGVQILGPRAFWASK